MSRILSELLGSNELGFRLSIEQLEKASGRPGADIRLSSEVLQATQQKIKELGLDPHDTTANELYSSLSERVRGDNDRLESALIHQKENNKITPNSIAKTINAVTIPKSCFALKHSVAKRLLKVVPPKVTLKRLGYRSIDSLLKREPVSAVFAAARLTEAPTWYKRVLDQYKNLTPSDFETRAIEVYAPSTAHWGALTSSLAEQHRASVVISKELGGLVILPLPLDIPGSTLATLFLAFQAMNDIRVYSAYCKLQQVKPNFGEIIAQTVKGNVRDLVLIAGQPLPWYVIQRHYSKFSNDYPLELFEPHVHREDLQLVACEDVLAFLEPTLEFWQNTEFLGFSKKDQVVSLNLLDVAINCSNQFIFPKRILSNFRVSLWSELLLKYLQQHELEQAVVQQLDAQLVDQGEPSFSPLLA